MYKALLRKYRALLRVYLLGGARGEGRGGGREETVGYGDGKRVRDSMYLK